MIDLFPPGPHDPRGIHKAIWDEIEDVPFELPRRLTLATYVAGPPPEACGDFVAVGDALSDMPLFLKPDYYVPAPLEPAYRTARNTFPASMKRLLE